MYIKYKEELLIRKMQEEAFENAIRYLFDVAASKYF